MNIEELMKELRAIKKIYWNINIYDSKLNWVKDIWVQKTNWNLTVINFYEFNK